MKRRRTYTPRKPVTPAQHEAHRLLYAPDEEALKAKREREKRQREGQE